jgi:hypothetical protein
MEKCKHQFEYKKEDVRLYDVNNGWYFAVRIIIYCVNCGLVTHDQINSNSSFSQNYRHIEYGK